MPGIPLNVDIALLKSPVFDVASIAGFIILEMPFVAEEIPFVTLEAILAMGDSAAENASTLTVVSFTSGDSSLNQSTISETASTISVRMGCTVSASFAMDFCKSRLAFLLSTSSLFVSFQPL